MTTLKLSACRLRLGVMWIAVSGLVFVVLFLQTLMSPMYQGHEKQVLEWFGAVLWPSTTLMLGALASDAFGRRDESPTVASPFFYITLVVCALYLSAVVVTIGAQLVPEAKPLSVLETAKPWLILFQGAISATVGAFFACRKTGA